MLRVTTLHASSAAATAAYYAKYLTAAPGEVPGTWSGRQANRFGLTGRVEQEQLEALLSGRDPVSGTGLGRELVDRYTSDGRVVRAVAGFDATFSAPKSLSVWWALTGDRRLLDAHDTAVTAALAHLERYGSTTRIRSNGARLHPDTHGIRDRNRRGYLSAGDHCVGDHWARKAPVQFRRRRVGGAATNFSAAETHARAALIASSTSSAVIRSQCRGSGYSAWLRRRRMRSIDLRPATPGNCAFIASMITMCPPADVGRRPWWASNAVAVLRAAS